MRKRIIDTMPSGAPEMGLNWLPVAQIASIEVTSESDGHPIEGALLSGTGWRAAVPGSQIIRLVFDHPQTLRHIHLVFSEHEVERSQEFVLRWSPDQGQTYHEIVRQQWNFSPHGATQEIEDYHVELSNVTLLELTIVPDRNNAEAHASLEKLQIA